ncbi:transposase domain-containing protein [Streptomyces acidicola]|uniref:transposase domain-containing protein n=1 Tax=Streptomyces acidicola TaxID=2596892 RepID=UPI003824ABF4
MVSRGLVDEVVDRTGRREKRVRLLPARVVAYFVLANCLFFADGCEDVVAYLCRRDGCADVRRAGVADDQGADAGGWLPDGSA